MSDKTVWFVTGAARGMGVNIVKEALSAGHAVVATGRNTDAVARAIGPADHLHIVKLDVTSEDDSKAAVADAVEQFARIDVLVNNAGNFYAGFFEELSPSDFRAQIETNFFGTVNVTRAVLPVMRAQRDGLIITISSTGGIVGQAFVSAYSAAKFAVEGWMESLAIEIAPFGIRTMLVEPGFFRTELLTDESTKWPEPSIEDYADTTRETVSAWKKMNGQQGGDPAKLAKALVQLASADTPPQRWPAGADAVETFTKKANELLTQARANEALSSSLSYDTGA
jgi:NAD(P)-dependent dehydrogenase (short-subunit alcohol dehydrogenase family)